MSVKRAEWCKVRANQDLSMLWQPCVPPTITMLRISESPRNTQYVKLQPLNDGSSSLPLPKITWYIYMQMKVMPLASFSSVLEWLYLTLWWRNLQFVSLWDGYTAYQHGLSALWTCLLMNMQWAKFLWLVFWNKTNECVTFFMLNP